MPSQPTGEVPPLDGSLPAESARDWGQRDFGVYVHVPFCEQLCPYCTFNRYPFDADAARDYFRHLRSELRVVHDAGYRFSWLYVGGGTPTVQMEELSSTLDLAADLFGETDPEQAGLGGAPTQLAR